MRSLDDVMRAPTGRSFDDGGITASHGKVDRSVIDGVSADPFFAAKPPKSLDRNAISYARLGLPDMSVADGAATLAALTAAAAAQVVGVFRARQQGGSWPAAAPATRH